MRLLDDCFAGVRLLVCAALILLAGCATNGDGILSPGGGDAPTLTEAGLSADDAFLGLTGDGFKVVRSNDAGYRDSALNRTLDLQSVSRGDVTVVTISVTDTDPMYGVTLELNYDPSQYNPQSVEFMGLVDTPIELATTTVNGLVAAGQVDVNGPAVRSGEFLTVTFANEPSTIVNKAASTVHDFPIDKLYEPGTIAAGTGAAGWKYWPPEMPGHAGRYRIRATFAVGDGNSDGETGIGDLTPIVAHGYFDTQNVEDTDYAPATADYNGDGRVSVPDLTAIGQNFQAFYTGIEVAISDRPTFQTTMLATLSIADSEEHTLPAPAGTTDWDDVFRTWTGEIAEADILANLDACNQYWVGARLTNGTDVGEWSIFWP